jgi:type I restriction enzyme S subunit
MSFPRYPKYKPSGVEWLGEVPEGWEVKRSDSFLTYSRAQLDPKDFQAQEVFHYSIPVVQETGTGQLEDGAEIASGKQVVKKKVVLVSKLNPRKGTICIAEPQQALTLCSTEFVALEPNGCDISYLSYLVKTEAFRQGLESKVTSVTNSHQRANPVDIYRFWNAWPVLAEQTAIAKFLDRETGKIDELVAEQRRLMELLKEKRQAVISHAVTKGLNPHAPMKPSGIEWLGNVPEGWEVMSLRRCKKRIQTGGTPPTADQSYYEDGTVPWFGPGSFDENLTVSEPIKWLNESAVKEGVARVFAAGATMIVTIGATLGKVSSLVEDGSCNQQITVIEFDPRRVCARFATYQIKRLEPALRAIAPSATLPILGLGEVADIDMVVPPLADQVAIVAHLDTELAKFDTLTAEAQRAIDLLQERRTALISAAVTGKIDVRQHPKN